MDKVMTWLFFMFFVFIALGIGVMPGLPVGVTRMAWYIAGWSSGVLAGGSMAAAGWIWVSMHRGE